MPLGFLAAVLLVAAPAMARAQGGHDHHAELEANASMTHHNHLNNPHMK